MDTALVVTGTKPCIGREEQALDHGVEVNDNWGKLAATGSTTGRAR